MFFCHIPGISSIRCTLLCRYLCGFFVVIREWFLHPCLLDCAKLVDLRICSSGIFCNVQVFRLVSPRTYPLSQWITFWNYFWLSSSRFRKVQMVYDVVVMLLLFWVSSFEFGTLFLVDVVWKVAALFAYVCDRFLLVLSSHCFIFSGPNLNGLFGRQSGTTAGYSYSAANKNKAVQWGEYTLYDYLLNPKKVLALFSACYVCRLKMLKSPFAYNYRIFGVLVIK